MVDVLYFISAVYSEQDRGRTSTLRLDYRSQGTRRFQKKVVTDGNDTREGSIVTERTRGVHCCSSPSFTKRTARRRLALFTYLLEAARHVGLFHSDAGRVVSYPLTSIRVYPPLFSLIETPHPTLTPTSRTYLRPGLTCYNHLRLSLQTQLVQLCPRHTETKDSMCNSDPNPFTHDLGPQEDDPGEQG